MHICFELLITIGFWKGVQNTMSKFNSFSPQRRAYFNLLFELWKEHKFAFIEEAEDAIILDTTAIMSILCQLTNVSFEKRTLKGCMLWRGDDFSDGRPRLQWSIGLVFIFMIKRAPDVGLLYCSTTKDGIQVGIQVDMTGTRALAQIVHGAEMLREREGLHRCNCGECPTLTHVLPESAATNLTRSSCPSSAECLHAIRCIFEAKSMSISRFCSLQSATAHLSYSCSHIRD